MTREHSITAAGLSHLPWLEVVDPSVHVGSVRHAVFDFDGTISVIRQGWEHVMIPLMVEMICSGHPPDPSIEAEVAEYVDRSTGILTIKQMRWLEEAVVRYGMASSPRTAREYKRIYNERLLRPVRQRMRQMDGTETARDSLMIVCRGCANAAWLFTWPVAPITSMSSKRPPRWESPSTLGSTSMALGTRPKPIPKAESFSASWRITTSGGGNWW